MSTFAERLKIAIEKRGISQAEAARLCGFTQQSINYIITNNLRSSKLGPQIASTLGINPEWLIYGRGKFEETIIYELPVILNPSMLIQFLDNTLDLNKVDITVINVELGEMPFAYLIDPNTMLICSTLNAAHPDGTDYLTINDTLVAITKQPTNKSFPIFERRIRYGTF